MLDAAIVKILKSVDTPTICNALELVGGTEHNRSGFTRQALVPARPELPPMLGYAATARCLSTLEVSGDEKRRRALEWYEHCASGPQPYIAVVQDVDNEPCVGALWGEVNSNVHNGLGAEGVITNGSFRDIGDLAKGFQILGGGVRPSHGFVHIADVGTPVTVAGLGINDRDLMHADRHGAVIIPDDLLDKLPGAIETLSKKEAPIIKAAQSKGFGMDALREAMKASADIH